MVSCKAHNLVPKGLWVRIPPLSFLEDSIAIFWNGPCHYYPIYGQKSLNQTQNRDKIKKSLFEKSGYSVYIIKDVDEVYPREIWKNRDKRTDVQLNLFLEFLGRKLK